MNPRSFPVVLLAAAGLLCGVLLCGACRPAVPPQARDEDGGLERLCDLMVGSYSSSAQATANGSYQDLKLRIRRIWEDRGDGRWVHVEWDPTDDAAAPAGQQIYRWKHLGREFYEGTAYALDAAETIEATTPDRLTPLAGCEFLLRETIDRTFEGSLLGRRCPDSLRGAAYANAEIAIVTDRIRIGYRGLDATGSRVWGVDGGPYEFVRVTATR